MTRPAAGKSPAGMMDTVTNSMRERTGRTLDEWLAVVEASGIDPLDQNAVRKWLKAEHGILQNTQWAIADAAARRAGWERPTTAQYTDAQYAGKKAALRPIYDALEAAILALGDDVHAEGRGGYTPFVRGRQFCAIAATTTRVDLGLRYPISPPISERLTPSTGPGQSTHKVALTAPTEVDDEILALLRAAYDQNP